MNDNATDMFQTVEGTTVPTVTSDQMREVDHIAEEEFGLGVLQMMENAGRNLTQNVLDMLGGMPDQVTVLVGSGGNGGGGLCCARHLHNRGVKVNVVLDRESDTLRGSAQHQWYILRAAGLEPTHPIQTDAVIHRSQLVIDALIGYSLRGVPRGRAAELIDSCNRHAARVLSLDVPSGLDATTGDSPGVVVRPDRTMTLALPKAGLFSVPGDLYLADIGIPPEVFHHIGVTFEPPFGDRYWVRLMTTDS